MIYVGGMYLIADAWDDGMLSYPQSLVLVPRGDDSSVVVGSHIRGSRLRATSAAGNEEVDLLLPGTARYGTLFQGFPRV